MSFFVSERFSKVLIFLGVFLLIVFLLSFSYKSIFFNFDVPIKTDVFGQFGDIVGGVIGSLWALAGVILFYAGLTEQRKDIQTNQNALEKQISALNYQKEEMELQRKEYAMARKVFEEQREALKEQAKTSRVQQFESNFYSLLDIYIGIRKDIASQSGSFISKVNKELSSLDIHNTEAKDKIKLINNKYQEIYYKNKDNISHYLKTIYRIYKTIDEQEDLNIKKKYFYSKIVRSQFTEEELFLIYYNAHSSYGVNFRPLILKYNILKHLMPISKVEFKFILDEDNSVNMKRHSITSWLDSFLSSNWHYMYDLEIENPSYSSELAIDSIGKIMIQMELDIDENIIIKITNSSLDIETKLCLEKGKMLKFIENYFYDRLINSHFEELSTNDYIDIVEKNDSILAKISIEKNINFVKDFV
ncbi:putative phage abortive infection protein [Vibrio sp. FJH11]